MTLFTIDKDLCLRDGICVAECPNYLIEMTDNEAYPTATARAELDCIECGHCVAVCPTGALSHRNLSPAECEEMRPDIFPNANQVEHLLRTRRSIRSFTGQPVPQAILTRLLDITSYAPSAGNTQPVEWLVIYDSAVVRRIGRLALDWLYQHAVSGGWSRRYLSTFACAQERQLDVVCRGAPHLIIAHVLPGQESNASIALTYLELAAYGLGLGACWCGFVNAAIEASPLVRETTGLPADRVVGGALLIGYPRYVYERVPSRKTPCVQWR